MEQTLSFQTVITIVKSKVIAPPLPSYAVICSIMNFLKSKIGTVNVFKDFAEQRAMYKLHNMML